MKKITLLLSIALFIGSCSLKQTKESLATGDYDAAIKNATESLRNRKEAKGKQEYIYILEEAYAKAKDRDQRNIDAWVKDSNPKNIENIYNTFQQLNNRQELIRPLLPLKLLKEGRDAIFPFEDYSDEIVSSKNTLVNYLYTNSKALLASKDKMSFRRAFDDFVYINQLSPGYKDVNKLTEEAQFKGTDFVSVTTKNETNMVIPVRLQDDLLDFSTYGLNDKWTVYHNVTQKNISYDYGLIVNFRQINISPEQVNEKEFVKEKQVKDGTRPKLDANENPIKDAQGVPIREDVFKTVKATVYEFRQFKSAQVTAKVDYVDNKSKQLIQTFPLASEFVFEYTYAKYNGDKNACDETYFSYFDRKSVPFPSNEQMVYDSGEDLKSKLKTIIVNNKFRK